MKYKDGQKTVPTVVASLIRFPQRASKRRRSEGAHKQDFGLSGCAPLRAQLPPFVKLPRVSLLRDIGRQGRLNDSALGAAHIETRHNAERFLFRAPALLDNGARRVIS